MQHNTTQQCNEEISEKYLGETGATQCNATVLHANFTRNKPSCNATQHNTTQHHNKKISENNLLEQVQCNATQQCYKEILPEINPSATQCNAAR